MTIDLSAYFEEFLQNISLGNPQVPRMNRAAETVAVFLTSSYGLGAGDVFPQGSYANQSAIEPVNDGEYDVDLVAVCVQEGLSANEALNDLEARFKSDGRFRERVNRKKPCIRLEYAPDDVGRFHVDVVPTRRTGVELPPLDAPRRDEGWRPTAPREYTEWCAAQGPLFVRTAKILKRWRTEHQSVRQAIKSIVLQVLIAEYMPQMADDAARVADTLRGLQDALRGLSTPPAVMNPVLPNENLAASWTNDSFESFRTELSEALEWAEQAIAATDEIEAANAWREILGDDFPILESDQLGLRLGDYSHAETPEERGWTVSTDPRYGVGIRATLQRGRRSQRRRPYPDNGPPVFAGGKLRFNASVTAPNHVAVWWQVANTGGHARDVNGLRGQIFQAKKLDGSASADETENWEGSAYTGSHLIRGLLVRNNTVVAESPWFRVNIYSKANRFRL